MANLETVKQRLAFQLPTTTLFTIARNPVSNKFIVHSLDFDLVCAGETEEEARSSAALAVKTYVEFGLSKGWNDEIRFPAPQEFWDAVTSDTPVRLGPSIYIDSKPMVVVQTELTAAA